MTDQNNALLDSIKWNSQGLIPVITQDAASKRVLMLAWISRDALTATIEKREAVYWSRSRQRLWHKGESSGHIQKIIDIRLDCDGDTLLFLVDQIGGIACHTGRESCMYQQYSHEEGWVTVEAPIKKPEDIY
ncbi:MAG: phosphoribosyl-AMP cyclohydrolase [Pseudomonadales bacterium]